LQYTDEDLDAAVGAGAMTAESAAGFRAFVEARRAAPAADEESFRLLTGFNDIFVSIALIMTLAALGWLGEQVSESIGAAVIAGASWALAEFFTRRRRMALPSILLLLAFVGGVAVTASLLWPLADGAHPLPRILFVGAAGTLAAFAHWKRFMVPITVAAGVLTFAGAGVAAVAALSRTENAYLYAVFAAGLATFALALAWDASDPTRKTRRADVAFWLHLLAAPAIVHPAFSLLGLNRFSLLDFAAPSQTPPFAVTVGVAIALYAALATVALIVDRRALMVSALAYLLFAMNSLFRATGALTLSAALSALIVGAGLLLLSAFWATARRGALRLAPASWRSRLPPAA
jgi:hypothetical protein